MGRYIDLFFWLLIFIVGLFIVRSFFKDPALLWLSIIILILFGITFLEFLSNSNQSDNNFFVKVFDFLLAVGLIFFLILPLFFGEATDTNGQSPAIEPTIIHATNPPVPFKTTTTSIKYIERTYHWTYGKHRPTYVLKIPEPLFEYYKAQNHDRNYAKYAISERDRKVLDAIITDFRENTDSKTEAAYNVVAFVQSLPYFTDVASTGYDEYPRYPIETLVNNGGDCEDTAILTAALLKEMNYDVVLVSPPGHMAVGITCSECSGASFPYNNKKYYYLETTGNNYKVGQMPPKYQNTKVRVYPI